MYRYKKRKYNVKLGFKSIMKFIILIIYLKCILMTRSFPMRYVMTLGLGFNGTEDINRIYIYFNIHQ